MNTLDLDRIARVYREAATLGITCRVEIGDATAFAWARGTWQGESVYKGVTYTLGQVLDANFPLLEQDLEQCVHDVVAEILEYNHRASPLVWHDLRGAPYYMLSSSNHGNVIGK